MAALHSNRPGLRRRPSDPVCRCRSAGQVLHVSEASPPGRRTGDRSRHDVVRASHCPV